MISHWKNAENKPPDAPYYAVIFISKKKEELPGYQEIDDKLMEMATQLPGYLGYSVVTKDSKSIFISYWEDMNAINHWKADKDHISAKQQAHIKWYDYFHSLICKVESSRGFSESLLF